MGKRPTLLLLLEVFTLLNFDSSFVLLISFFPGADLEPLGAWMWSLAQLFDFYRGFKLLLRLHFLYFLFDY